MWTSRYLPTIHRRQHLIIVRPSRMNLRLPLAPLIRRRPGVLASHIHSPTATSSKSLTKITTTIRSASIIDAINLSAGPGNTVNDGADQPLPSQREI